MNIQRVIGKGLLVALFLFLCFAFPVRAQFHKPSELTVRIGEELPEYLWQYAHLAVDSKTGRDTVIRLADHRDKLIILDFWASWCGGCLYSLHKLDSLGVNQRMEDVLIIPVNYEDRDRSMRVFANFDWEYTSIVGDTLLNKVFPYQSLPHMVWIRDGRVWGFPKSQVVTASLIREVADGTDPEVEMKFEDRMLDPSRPLFIGDNSESRRLIALPGVKIVAQNTHFRWETPMAVQDRDSIILYANNLRLSSILTYAFKEDVFPGYHSNFRKAILIHRSIGDEKWSGFRDRFGFEVRASNEKEAILALKEALVQLLAEQYGVLLTLESTQLETYALLETTHSPQISQVKLASESLSTDRGDLKNLRHFYGITFQHALNYSVNRALRELPDLDLTLTQVVNRTGIGGDFIVNMSLGDKYGSLEGMNHDLEPYGLKVRIEKRFVPSVYLTTKSNER